MKELSLDNCRLDKRYDIRDPLGRGSYAEVFLARHTVASPDSPHCDVVIKALNVFLQDDLDPELERTLVENFQNEAVALDRVRHPNIISRLGHGTARDLHGAVFHYLVLEYLSGGNLQSLLRKKRIDMPTAMAYVEQICAGLSHAHSRDIIHRDIKPQNLLLTEDLKTVKIADFGVARLAMSDSPITRVGTNVYAPPEHSPLSAGQTGKLIPAGLTPAADVYSLAKTVYTVVTGEAPRAFTNEQVTALPEAFRGENWSAELLRVLSKATNSDPRDRHATVEEFWTDLTALREIASDGEYATVAAGEVPRPHISRGYTAKVPAAPRFDPITESPKRRQPALELPVLIENARPAPMPITRDAVRPPIFETHTKKPRRRTWIRRYATLLISIGLFVGILYGTASYMRGRGVFPEIRNPFRTQTAVANKDVHLRSAPNTDTDPIGLVTKNSRVKIVKTENNWYQVDIIQQGRERSGPASATRGWLNSRYLEMDSN